VPLRGVDGVLISLSVAVESIGGQTTESVTHGQNDARPTVTFPAEGYHRPLARLKYYYYYYYCVC